MNGKKVIITKRFRKNVFHVYNYLIEEFSRYTADNFLILLEKRIDFIANNPTVGKSSTKRKNIRSILFAPHNQLFTGMKMKPLKCYVSLIWKEPSEKTFKIELKRNAIN